MIVRSVSVTVVAEGGGWAVVSEWVDAYGELAEGVVDDPSWFPSMGEAAGEAVRRLVESCKRVSGGVSGG